MMSNLRSGLPVYAYILCFVTSLCSLIRNHIEILMMDHSLLTDANFVGTLN